ncbi:MAG: amidohydrolase family protein, partial [Pseudomonadota bacterium]
TQLAQHEVVLAAWEGLDPARVWDCHVHVAGAGDGSSGVWVTPRMDSWLHPIQFIQKRFYLNAGCAEREGEIDTAYLARLLEMQRDMRAGSKLMLLAFDYNHDAAGQRDLAHSAFHAPDRYARDLAHKWPEHFEWIASIHPHRADALEALESAARDGARALKWLPSAMGIDPAAARCDRFYESLARLGLPLLSHAGDEMAVHGGAAAELNNPLRLRRALDHGVTVIVAHSASLGAAIDLDRGPNGSLVDSFDLFGRLMEEHRYAGRLYAELSAMTQRNRIGRAMEILVERDEWHGRILNGSDYPLVAVMPLFSLSSAVTAGYLTNTEAGVLAAIRRYNPLLFDFVFKRRFTVRGKRFGRAVFETRRAFERPAGVVAA